MLVVDGLMLFEHLVAFLSHLGCVCVLACELIICGPMPFNNWNSYSIVENKKKQKQKNKK